MFVTIGPHHSGPHVDALFALVERCGGKVIVFNVDEHETAPADTKRAGRITYAGYERADAARFDRWGAS
jgi:hypothetical protein